MGFNWTGKSADGKTITLHRLDEERFEFPQYFNAEWAAANADSIRIGAAVDVETTGLSQSTDQVIEIGVRPFKFNRHTGEILSLEKPYSAFQDPGAPLSEEIISLTGITDDMVRGQSIDWNKVNEILDRCQIVIAHNAGFDRPFIDRSSSVSQTKIWACSVRHIDWSKKGFVSQKLELLSIFHGVFTDSHRALNDADALVYLLSRKDTSTGTAYLLELLGNARRPTINIIAANSPFESKDRLKGRHYRWDNQGKYWSKSISKEQFESEVQWLTESVYGGFYKGRHSEIQPVDNFKSAQD